MASGRLGMDEEHGIPKKVHIEPYAPLKRSEGSAKASEVDSRAPAVFRTLSIQVYDSRHPETKATKAEKAELDAQFFERVAFHKIGVTEVCQQFNVSPDLGLDNSVSSRRLQRDGRNTITQKHDSYILRLLGYIFGGFCSILWLGVIVFFVCWQPLSDPPSVINLALAIVLILVIMLQASFSAFQDWSTKKVMNSILDLLPSECVVVRDGETRKIPSTYLVVGDVIRLSAGNKVPADARLIEVSGDVRFDRAILTGEAEEVPGSVDVTDDNFLETRNIALMGTHVTNGSAKAVIVLTGAQTVMGRINKLTNSTRSKMTLIQKEITRFVIIIIGLTVILIALILIAWGAWLRVDHFAFMNVVGMLDNVLGCVVAFIPEGLPVAVTLTLSRIAHRMKSVNVLPKTLSTVETLGCVTVICSDKTGTLTRNQMSVASMGFVDAESTVTEAVTELAQSAASPPFTELHRAVVLCNNASFDSTTRDLPISQRKVNGDATDGAALCFGEFIGAADEIRRAYPRVFQIPFNSKNKWMLTIHDRADRVVDDDADSKNPPHLVYVKGAPDVLAPYCTSYWSVAEERVVPFTDAAKTALAALQAKWSRAGQRVILVCGGEYFFVQSPGSNAFGDEVASEALNNLTIISLLGIMDPPRPEIFDTVVDCRRAGCRFFMVTGDFGLTAAAIARQTGIFTGSAEPDVYEDVRKRAHYSSGSGSEKDEGSGDDDGVKNFIPDTNGSIISHSLLLEGRDLVRLTDTEWDAVCRYEEIVFARTTPEQKLRIVNEFKQRDNIVAVTGDGVNDAPALKAADVGIAMVSGSDVAIEAANLVLMGSFSSITEGIRLGRLVFQNLQKVIAYLLPAGSWSEVWPVVLNVFLGVPLPLSSFLMLIICCFTDLGPCLALIMEKEEFDLLTLPPRNAKKDHLISMRIYGQAYFFVGLMESVIAHSMFFFYMWKYAGIPAGALFLAFENYSDGFYGYSAEELVHFNNTGQCVYFVTLVILQWGNILSVRNKRLSILQADPIRKQRRNLWLFVGALAALVIAVFVTEVQGFNNIFGTAPVPIEFWLIPLPLALGILVADETRKLIVRTWPKSIIARMAW